MPDTVEPKKTSGAVPAPKQKIYKTSDIAIASCLILNQTKLLKLEPMANVQKGRKVPQNHYFFVFVDDNIVKREEIVMGYLDKSLKVVPSDFMDTIRKLKQQTKETALT